MRQYVREQAEQLLNPGDLMPGFPEGTPTVTIELDGPKVLGFTLGSMRRIKDALGSLELDQDEEGAILALPVYVWACMASEDRATTSPGIIEDMIHPLNMRAISDKIAELFKASQPEGAEGNEVPAPPKGKAGKK